MPNLSEIGERGLVVYDGEHYHYVTEGDWRNRPLQEPAPQIDAAANNALTAGAILAKLESQNTVLVDLDTLPKPEASTTPSGPIFRPWHNPTRDTEPSVLLRETKNGQSTFYQVREDDWQLLEAGFEGDAGVLVRRGALVAAIPRNEIPSGSYCVLVNLASIAPK